MIRYRGAILGGARGFLGIWPAVAVCNDSIKVCYLELKQKKAMGYVFHRVIGMFFGED